MTADLLPPERRDELAEVPPWPSDEHREAARLWLERHRTERPYDGGIDPTLLQRLAAERQDEFVEAVERHVSGVKGWKVGDPLRWLAKNCEFVRDDRDDRTVRQRSERLRGQGSDWRRGPPVPPPPPPAAGAALAPEGNARWKAVSEAVRGLVVDAAKGVGVSRADALADGRRLLATLTEPDPALSSLVEALALPPPGPGWWDGLLGGADVSAYDRVNWLGPLVPIGLSVDELVLVAPDESHAQFVAEALAGFFGRLPAVRWVG